MKLRKIIFGCGMTVSALLCTSTVLALNWYSSNWTIPNQLHRPTLTVARKATTVTPWTKITNVEKGYEEAFKSAIGCQGGVTKFKSLVPGVECFHNAFECGLNVGDYIQAGFKNISWSSADATIHWAP